MKTVILITLIHAFTAATSRETGVPVGEFSGDDHQGCSTEVIGDPNVETWSTSVRFKDEILITIRRTGKDWNEFSFGFESAEGEPIGSLKFQKSPEITLTLRNWDSSNTGLVEEIQKPQQSFQENLNLDAWTGIQLRRSEMQLNVIVNGEPYVKFNKINTDPFYSIYAHVPSDEYVELSFNCNKGTAATETIATEFADIKSHDERFKSHEERSPNDETPTTAIIIIIVVIIIMVAALSGGCWYWRRRRGGKDEKTNQVDGHDGEEKGLLPETKSTDISKCIEESNDQQLDKIFSPENLDVSGVSSSKEDTKKTDIQTEEDVVCRETQSSRTSISSMQEDQISREEDRETMNQISREEDREAMNQISREEDREAMNQISREEDREAMIDTHFSQKKYIIDGVDAESQMGFVDEEHPDKLTNESLQRAPRNEIAPQQIVKGMHNEHQILNVDTSREVPEEKEETYSKEYFNENYNGLNFPNQKDETEIPNKELQNAYLQHENVTENVMKGPSSSQNQQSIVESQGEFTQNIVATQGASGLLGTHSTAIEHESLPTNDEWQQQFKTTLQSEISVDCTQQENSQESDVLKEDTIAEKDKQKTERPTSDLPTIVETCKNVLIIKSGESDHAHPQRLKAIEHDNLSGGGPSPCTEQGSDDSLETNVKEIQSSAQELKTVSGELMHTEDNFSSEHNEINLNLNISKDHMPMQSKLPLCPRQSESENPISQSSDELNSGYLSVADQRPYPNKKMKGSNKGDRHLPYSRSKDIEALILKEIESEIEPYEDHSRRKEERCSTSTAQMTERPTSDVPTIEGTCQKVLIFKSGESDHAHPQRLKAIEHDNLSGGGPSPCNEQGGDDSLQKNVKEIQSSAQELKTVSGELMHTEENFISENNGINFHLDISKDHIPKQSKLPLCPRQSESDNPISQSSEKLSSGYFSVTDQRPYSNKKMKGSNKVDRHLPYPRSKDIEALISKEIESEIEPYEDHSRRKEERCSTSTAQMTERRLTSDLPTIEETCQKVLIFKSGESDHAHPQRLKAIEHDNLSGGGPSPCTEQEQGSDDFLQNNVKEIQSSTQELKTVSGELIHTGDHCSADPQEQRECRQHDYSSGGQGICTEQEGNESHQKCIKGGGLSAQELGTPSMDPQNVEEPCNKVLLAKTALKRPQMDLPNSEDFQAPSKGFQAESINSSQDPNETILLHNSGGDRSFLSEKQKDAQELETKSEDVVDDISNHWNIMTINENEHPHSQRMAESDQDQL